MALYLAHPSSHLHDTGPHPENAGRLREIEAALDQRDWLGLERVQAPAATREQIARVHSPELIDRIESLAAAGGGMIDLDTAVSADSWEAALHGAGAAVLGAERLLGGDETVAFCGTRPPGHHAERDTPMGFCLFNNAAVAAAHAIDELGAARVLILDWDVHHGNGTEEIFAASDSVLYSSIHQSPLYPGTGPASYVGTGTGEGYTVNLPVPPGAGGELFLSLVQHVVAPIARAFEPGLLIISSGYDAHRMDPLGSCAVETADFGEMSATMRDLARELEVPLLICLEGGYDPRALAESVVATLEAVTGDGPARTASREPAAAAAELHSARWPVLSPA